MSDSPAGAFKQKGLLLRGYFPCNKLILIVFVKKKFFEIYKTEPID